METFYGPLQCVSINWIWLKNDTNLIPIDRNTQQEKIYR